MENHGGAHAIARAESRIGAATFTTVAVEVAGAQRAESASSAVRDALATSKQGRRAAAIVTTHEILGALEALHDAVRSRAALVVHAVHDPRAEGPGRDELAPALEIGAGVVATWSVADATLATFAVRRAAEDSESPFLHCYDGPAETFAESMLPSAEVAARFLGHELAVRSTDPGPASKQNLSVLQKKRAERTFAARVPFALASALREIGEASHGIAPIERFETADAEEVIVALGGAFLAARAVARVHRAQGKRVGALGVRALRPFFAADAVKACARAKAIVVIEPLDVALAPCGPLAAMLKAAFADAITWAPGFPGVGRVPPIVSAVFATLEGAVSERDVAQALAEIAAGDHARRLVVFGSDA